MLGCRYFAGLGFISQDGSLTGGRGCREQKVSSSWRQKHCGRSSPVFLLVTALQRFAPFFSITRSFRGHGNHWIKVLQKLACLITLIRTMFMRSDQAGQCQRKIGSFSSINKDYSSLLEVLQNKSIREFIAQVLATSLHTDNFSLAKLFWKYLGYFLLFAVSSFLPSCPKKFLTAQAVCESGAHRSLITGNLTFSKPSWARVLHLGTDFPGQNGVRMGFQNVPAETDSSLSLQLTHWSLIRDCEARYLKLHHFSFIASENKPFVEYELLKHLLLISAVQIDLPQLSNL